MPTASKKPFGSANAVTQTKEARNEAARDTAREAKRHEEKASLRVKNRIKKAKDSLLDSGMPSEARDLEREAVEFKKFSDLVEWYLSLAEVEKFQSYSQKAGQLRILTAFFDNYQLREIGDTLIREYRKWREQGGHTYATGKLDLAGEPIMRVLPPTIHTTINEDLQTLKTMLKKAGTKVPKLDLGDYTRDKVEMPQAARRGR